MRRRWKLGTNTATRQTDSTTPYTIFRCIGSWFDRYVFDHSDYLCYTPLRSPRGNHSSWHARPFHVKWPRWPRGQSLCKAWLETELNTGNELYSTEYGVRVAWSYNIMIIIFLSTEDYCAISLAPFHLPIPIRLNVRHLRISTPLKTILSLHWQV